MISIIIHNTTNRTSEASKVEDKRQRSRFSIDAKSSYYTIHGKYYTCHINIDTKAAKPLPDTKVLNTRPRKVGATRFGYIVSESIRMNGIGILRTQKLSPNVSTN